MADSDSEPILQPGTSSDGEDSDSKPSAPDTSSDTDDENDCN